MERLLIERMKRIVLTGVTRGLGRALAYRFREAGHQVIGCGRNAAQVAELQLQFGPNHAFHAVDVADNQAVQAWANSTLASFGPPDVLINNAAIIHHHAPVWMVPVQEFDRVIDVNIKGAANVLRHFVPSMVQRGQGLIVNMSSGWGRSVDAEAGPYCATKWAIEGLTKTLALELPAGMAAVPLNPGIINTDMLRQCFAQEAHHYPTADAWSHAAAPYILNLGPDDNGHSRSVPFRS